MKLKRLISILHNSRGLAPFYFARLLPGLLNFALITFLTQKLTAADYGVFSIWFAISLGGGFYFFGWISQSIARHANANDDLLARSPETFVFACLVSLATIGVMLVGVVAIQPPTQSISLVAIGVSTSLHGLHSVISAVFQARFQHTQYLAVEVIRPLLILTITLAFIRIFGETSSSAINGFTIGQLISIAITAWIFRNRFTLRPSTIFNWNLSTIYQKSAIITIFKYGAPISLWLGIVASWPAVDRKLLGILSSPTDVGLYASEYDLIFRAFVFALLPITLFAQPKIFRAYSCGEAEQLNSIIKRSLFGMAAVGILFSTLCQVGIYVAKTHFGILLNIRPMSAAVLSLSAVSWQIALICHKYLECVKNVKLMVALLISAYALVAAPASFMLFEYFGSMSFAIGSLLGGLGYSFASLYLGKKLIAGECQND